MYNPRTLSLTITLLMAACIPQARAQLGFNSYGSGARAAPTTFVTDYQAIGINPANLGLKWRHENKHVAFGLLEGTYAVHSDALTRSDIRKRVINADFRFTEAEKEEAGRTFANVGTMANADLMSVGLCYANEKVGGFAFQIRDRIQVSAKLGPRMSQIMFEGYRADYFDLLVLATGDTVANYANMSLDSLAMVILGVATEPQMLGKVVSGTDIGLSWYREMNFSYGRHVVRNDNFELDLGIGVKYLQGIGIVDIRADQGRLNGFSSLSDDFQIDYQNAEFVPSARLTGGMVALPKSVGSGLGVDVGMTMLIAGSWKVGAALTDLGSIRWKGNVYSTRDASLLELATSGLENLDIISGLEDFVTNSGVLQWEHTQERKVPLVSTARIGLGKLLGKYAELGADVIIPLNDATGSVSSAVFGAGADVRPVPWFQLSAGIVAGGGLPVKVPAGFTFIVGKGTWEAGFASRDLITFFTQSNPTLSLSMGFLRFRF